MTRGVKGSSVIGKEKVMKKSKNLYERKNHTSKSKYIEKAANQPLK